MPNDQSWNVAAPRLAQNISLLAAYVALAAPAISASAASSSSITISLTSPVTGATRYTIERSPDGENWSLLIDFRVESDFPYPDDNLDPETTYYYRATASNETYTSDPSGVTQDETPAEQGGGGGGSTLTGNLVRENFDPAIMSPSFNQAGFNWSSLNRTSIVTVEADGDKITLYNSSGQVYNKDTIASRDWTPRTPLTNSLRFRFPESPGASEAMAEQRFTMNPQPEVWVGFWLRVPINFTHPRSSGGQTNSKFLALWKERYDNEAMGTATWQLHGDGNGGSLISIADGGVQVGAVQYTQFINVPADRGRWMHVVFHLKSATSASANDGVLELWRRWENQSSYTKIHDLQNANTYESGASNQGYRESFILGSHRGYQAETEWLLQDFELSTESLL